MSLDRPTPNSVSLRPVAKMVERARYHRRTIVLSFGAVIGIAMTINGAIAMASGPMPIQPDGEPLTQTPSRTTQTMRTNSVDLDEDRRAVSIVYELDQGLGLSPGDQVELVALSMGPIEAVVKPLGQAEVFSVDLATASAVVIVDREQALEVVTAQTEGTVRILGQGT